MKHETQTYKEIFTHSSYSFFRIPQTHKQYLTYPDNQLSSNKMFTTKGSQTVLGKKERKLLDSMHHSFLPGFCWLEAKYIHINESQVDKQVFDVDQILIALAMWASWYMCNAIMFLIFSILNSYPWNSFENSLKILGICLLSFIVTDLFETPAAISFLQH